MPRSATVKPDARISRRDGRDARPCPRTRHTPRRTGTAHVCQHPTTSPAPATLRHFREVSFEVHFDWLFLFFEALRAVLLLARRGFEKHEGDPHGRAKRHSAPCIPCQQYSERAARAPVTVQAYQRCNQRCTMGPGHAPGLEHENHQTSAATDSSTEGQRPPERDPHE
jgi:hypothetical protein